MKSRLISVTAIVGLVFLFVGIGFCDDQISMSEWVQKMNNGSVNWTAGYIEAVGIGVPPEQYIGKPNARPMAMRAAKIDAYRNLLEITKGVQVDSATLIKDFVTQSDSINTQVSGLVQGAQVADQRYMPDGTVEVKLRMPLYGSLAKIIIPAAVEKQKVEPPPELPNASTPVPPVQSLTTPATPSAPIAYTGLVIDARALQARPAMSPRIFDEEGKEVYGSASVDRTFAVQQGMSGYARDLNAAQSNQRVTANPLTVKALQASGPGKSDLIISKADAEKVRSSAENMSFIKKCRVMIVLD